MTLRRVLLAALCGGRHDCNAKQTVRVLLSRRIHQSSVLQKSKKTASHQWFQRQQRDPYVKQAHDESYRCRSAFKLLEMDDKHHVLRPGDVVVDCGAAPGSWTQVAVERVGAGQWHDDLSGGRPRIGQVIGVDLQPMVPIEGAILLQECDFTQRSVQRQILDILEGRRVDVVLSDMAPNPSGLKSLDHDNNVDLCLSALKFSAAVLEYGGAFLCKLWSGGRQAELQKLMQQCFNSVKVVKPHASRTDSAEIYLLGKQFTGRPQV